MKLLASIAIACSALTLSPTYAADVMVGGQPMMPGKTIVANAVNSADHTTLVLSLIHISTACCCPTPSAPAATRTPASPSACLLYTSRCV